MRKPVLIIVVLLIGALVFLGIFIRGAGRQEEKKPSMGEDISFNTSDGVKIAATFYKASNQNGIAVILLHMRARSRGDWEDFAIKLNNAGFDTLAIDFRGPVKVGEGISPIFPTAITKK